LEPTVAGFPPPGAEIVEVTFAEGDKPPLGLDMDWQNPPQVLQVMPDTPASRNGVRAGDQLYKVSGKDVTMMRREEILPLFAARPVLLELVRVAASSGAEAVAPEIVDIDFDKDDQNPLGLEMEWKNPPEVIRVIADTPAERRGCLARDRLISVNGQDTTNMTWIQILKLFSNRPLSCRFERDPRQAAIAGRSSPQEKKKAKKKTKKEDDKTEVEEELPAELVEAVFTEEDRPPLGLDMDWRQPPEVIQVMASTPAAKRGIKARDKLQTVNGVDVANLPREQILPLFGARPLRVTFLREQKKKKKKKKKDVPALTAEGSPESPPAGESPTGDQEGEPMLEDEQAHQMAPPTDSSGAKVPIPSSQFIMRYMNRLEERQRAAPQEQYRGKDDAETEQKDMEAQKSRAYTLRENIQVSTWNQWRIFVAIVQVKHRAFQWVAPQPDSIRLLRALQFWIYVFTHLAFMALYSRDYAICPQPPAAGEVTCNLPDVADDTEAAAVGGRLLRSIIRMYQFVPEPMEWSDDFAAWQGRALAEEAVTVNATDLAMMQAQCDAVKASVAYQVIEYEKCVEASYLFNFSFFKMAFSTAVLTFLLSVVAGMLVGLLAFSFKKKKIRDKRSIAEKLRIVQFWKVKELFAIFYAICWIGMCVFYLFMFAVNEHGDEYASTNIFSFLMQWLKPFGACYGIYLLITVGAKFPIGRFLLTLAPTIVDFKHMVYETPEDLVAARRERTKRKDLLKKEVNRLRKTVDKSDADKAREFGALRVASKEGVPAQ
jgi:C-terminal processing protease CtpA/Prc